VEHRRKRNCWNSDGDNICGDAVYTGSGEQILRLFFNGYEFKIFSGTR
jgi:hypothetical protein